MSGYKYVKHFHQQQFQIIISLLYFREHYGLYAVDKSNDFERIPKASTQYYKGVISSYNVDWDFGSVHKYNNSIQINISNILILFLIIFKYIS